MQFQEFNSDQRREYVNTQQRYAAYRDAALLANSYRGSMVWADIKGREYLLRSSYDKTGIRRQTSLGARSEQTEKIKAKYDQGRTDAEARLKEIQEIIDRQTAINRAVGLARVPLVGARIIRALDAAGMLGTGIRILGTYAIYAYEAMAGIRIDPGLTTTEDIDLLFDSRGGLKFAATENISEHSLLRLLQKVDRTFKKSNQPFRAVNKDGYLVDLIKPIRNPPWQTDGEKVGADADDLIAAEIEGLTWHESSPPFEAIAIDEKGEPLRIVCTDPRVWAAHKLWLSKRADRDPIKRRRDEAQAQAAGSLAAIYMPHLPFESNQLRMLPKEVFDQAKSLFPEK